MKEPLIIALSTCPPGDAARLAEGLVQQRLAACVNVVPGLQSIYRWQDKIESDKESLMIIKTAGSRWDALSEWLTAHHPYDVPELLAVPATRGLTAYLQWAGEALEADPS